MEELLRENIGGPSSKNGVEDMVRHHRCDVTLARDKRPYQRRGATEEGVVRGRVLLCQEHLYVPTEVRGGTGTERETPKV